MIIRQLKRLITLVLCVVLVAPSLALAVRDYAGSVSADCFGRDASPLNIDGTGTSATIHFTQPTIDKVIGQGGFNDDGIRTLHPVVEDQKGTTAVTTLFAGTQPFWQKEISSLNGLNTQTLQSFVSGYLRGRQRGGTITGIFTGIGGGTASGIATALKEDPNSIIRVEAYVGARLRDNLRNQVPLPPHSELRVVYKTTVTFNGTPESVWGLAPSASMIPELERESWWVENGFCRFLINPESFESFMGNAGLDIDGNGYPDGTGTEGVPEGDTSTNGPDVPDQDDVDAATEACSFPGFSKLTDWIFGCVIAPMIQSLGVLLLNFLFTGSPADITSALPTVPS